jgi:hypothetical protein
MTEILDTLSKFGTHFQTKCVLALMTDKEFVEQSYDIVQPAYFESDANKWLVEKILWYFNSYKSLPTPEVIAGEVQKIPQDNMLRLAVMEQFRIVFSLIKTGTDDAKYIKNEFLTFCKNQALKNAVLESADLLQTGKYDQIKVLIDRAINAGMEQDLGHDWKNDIDIRTSAQSRNVVPTPWPVINDLMDGGLGAGELGCIVAPSGIGKSWVLTKIGAHAMYCGFTVAHYSFELQQNYLGLRYDTCFTGIEPNKIKDHKDVVRDMADIVKGKLYIKYFPTRTVTINALTAHMQRLAMLGHKPDLVIIDYADLMRSCERSNARHEELGFIHEEIRGAVGELKIPGWTASQSQRSSLQDEIVEADKIAGSYGKIMVNDFIMSLSRQIADKLSNTARAYVMKNRFGKDGITYPVHMDLEHGVIDIFDENSPQGMQIKQQMTGGDKKIKELLKKQLIDHRKTNRVEETRNIPQSDIPAWDESNDLIVVDSIN